MRLPSKPDSLAVAAVAMPHLYCFPAMLDPYQGSRGLSRRFVLRGLLTMWRSQRGLCLKVPIYSLLYTSLGLE